MSSGKTMKNRKIFKIIIWQKSSQKHKTREKSCKKVRKRPVDVGKWEIKNLAIEWSWKHMTTSKIYCFVIISHKSSQKCENKDENNVSSTLTDYLKINVLFYTFRCVLVVFTCFSNFLQLFSRFLWGLFLAKSGTKYS